MNAREVNLDSQPDTSNIPGLERQAVKQVVKRTPLYRGYAKARVIHRYGLYRQPGIAARYLVSDPELDNFTYDITNRDELAAFVVQVTGVSEADVRGFIGEVDAMQISKPLGRRIGWYALVRALRPALIFETGTHLGLGATTLGSAAQQNGAGRVVSFDISPNAGSLIPADLPVEKVVGDTAATLPATIARLGAPDVFLHDSDHSYAHEAAEFAAVYRPGMLLLSDNSHVTSALADFAAAHGLTYTYFQEQPADHWYPGGGIGAAWSSTRR